MAFELIQKTMLVTDPKTGKNKWQSPQTKHDYMRAMIAEIRGKGIPFRYVTADVWFSSNDNMAYIKQRMKKDFIMPLKSNRKVALSLADKNRGKWQPLSSLNLETDTLVTLYLEGLDFPLVVARQVFSHEDGSEGILYLCSSDLELSVSNLFSIYQKRWKIEEYHKSLKSHASLAKSPTKLPHTQSNHFFSSIVAFVKLENYRCATQMNHFALRGKLYQAALSSAFEQLLRLKAALPTTATIT